MNLAMEIKELLPLSQVTKLYSIDCDTSGRWSTCPICKTKERRFRVLNDRSFQCYQCKNKGSIIDLMIKTGKCLDVSQALSELSQHVDKLGIRRQYKRRTTTLDKIFSVYKKMAKDNWGVVDDYCKSRGWVDPPLIGLAPNGTCLSKNGLQTIDLEETHYFYMGKEYYDNHLVFPVYNSIGHLVHLSGRALDDRELRWKSSKGTPSIDKYFFNSSILYNPKTNYIIIAEGVSDCISLLQMGEPAIAQFGVNVKLDDFAEQFSKFDYIICMYDSDKYSKGSPQVGQYKSWGSMLPSAIDLVCKINKPIYYLMVPNKPGIKDINDWLNSINYNFDLYADYVVENVKPLSKLACEVYKNDITDHSKIWRLLSALEDTELADQFFKQQPKDYLLKLFKD